MTAVEFHQLEEWIETACRWEAGAPKPGNVHPAAAFDDLTYDDFTQAARAAAPHLARSNELGVGAAVLNAIEATRDTCGSNVNLGICLLIAPLAAVPMNVTLKAGIVGVLNSLTDEDARNIYGAIRIAHPGGLGEVDEQDVAEPPTCGLIEAMRLAEERDRIGWNYVHDFEDVVVTAPALLERWIARGVADRDALIVGLQLDLLARIPDSLIARKCGTETAREASRQAKQILDSGWPETEGSPRRLEEFDQWLRADGHRRNPGTTADLIAAALFAVLRDHPVLALSLSSAASAPPRFNS